LPITGVFIAYWLELKQFN